MNKYFLFIIFSIAFSVKAQTSVYHEFPDSNANWNIHFYVYPTLSWPPSSEHYTTTISGDTIINASTYHKLNIPHIQVDTNGACFMIFFTGYQGAIRQDTLIKKVYYVSPYDTTEQLLYDFTLQIGDTVKGYFGPNYLVFPATVYSIDSILIGNNYRKMWNISGGIINTIIEGIGSSFGLLESPYPNASFQCPLEFTLTCFSQNGASLYPNGATNCQIITNATDISNFVASSVISPNPFISLATLKVPLEYENAAFKIYNVAGLLVRSQTVTYPNTLIKRETLCSGIYFYKIINRNGELLRGKFIIQ